jgi:hypothetical protein
MSSVKHLGSGIAEQVLFDTWEALFDIVADKVFKLCKSFFIWYLAFLGEHFEVY